MAWPKPVSNCLSCGTTKTVEVLEKKMELMFSEKLKSAQFQMPPYAMMNPPQLIQGVITKTPNFERL
jgi:hypothetical protein